MNERNVILRSAMVTFTLTLAAACGGDDEAFPSSHIELTAKSDLAGEFLYVLAGEEPIPVILQVTDDSVLGIRPTLQTAGSSPGRDQRSTEWGQGSTSVVAAFALERHVDMVGHPYSTSASQSTLECRDVDDTTRPQAERQWLVVHWHEDLLRGATGRLLRSDGKPLPTQVVEVCDASE